MDNSEKIFLSVIIPAFNEAERIPNALIDIDKHLSLADFSYEIIVINDGSSDNTAEVVSKFIPLVNGLRIITNEKNQGKGKGVRQGMLEARGKYRLFTDADNSTSVDHFFKMIPFFEEGYGVVIASRDIPGAKLVPPQPFYRRLLGNIGNLIIQTLLLWGIRDTQCGFKCFRDDVAKMVFPLMRIDRWAIDVEALSLAKEMGFRIKEIPVTWVNDTRSRVKSSAYFGVLRDVLKIRWWLSTDSYGIRRKQ